MKRAWILSIAAMLVLIICFGANAEQKKTVKDRQFVIEEKQKPNENINELKDIDNPNAAFKIELWSDKENATYKIGEEIVFSFKTNKDCRLTLLNVGTSGNVQVLFPNKFQKDNRVKAGKVYQIPAADAQWIYKAAGPAGEDLMKAIATLDKVELIAQADMKPAGPIQEVKKPESAIAKDIEVILRPVNSRRWSEAEKTIKITE